MKNSSSKEIIIGVCGGISAYKSCEIVRALRKKNYGVTVLMTEEAGKFIGEITFRTLSGRPVVKDMFAENFDWDPTHISLADRADLIVIVPATAHMIGKLAMGLCDDIISCVTLATKAKVLVCPAMNDNMYNHPAFQANLKKISALGYQVQSPIKGQLACGREGIGHLAEVADIISKIEKLIK